MALDGLAWAFDAAGLDDVGVERALHQPVHSACFFGDARSLVVEDGDELSADALSLCLRVDDPSQLLEEAFAGVHSDNFQAKFLAQILLDILEFVFAQDAVVDEDAGELAADRKS